MGERWSNLDLTNCKKLLPPLRLRDKAGGNITRAWEPGARNTREELEPWRKSRSIEVETLELPNKIQSHRGNTANCQKPKWKPRGRGGETVASPLLLSTNVWLASPIGQIQPEAVWQGSPENIFGQGQNPHRAREGHRMTLKAKLSFLQFPKCTVCFSYSLHLNRIPLLLLSHLLSPLWSLL